MALSITNHILLGDDENVSWNIATGSFTPPNNSLLVVMATTLTAFLDATPAWSISGGSLTWTKQVEYTAPDSGSGLCCAVVIWTAPVVTGASMTVTVNADSSVDWVTNSLTVSSVTGHDINDPIGLLASQGHAQLVGHSGAESLSLGGTTKATSAVFSVLLADGDNEPQVINAWPSDSPTELMAVASGSPAWARKTHAYIMGARSTAEWESWTSSYGHAVGALEIKAPLLTKTTTYGSDVATSSLDTALTVTLGANSLVLVEMVFENGGLGAFDAATPITISGTAMTWTKLTDTHSSSAADRCRIVQYAAYSNGAGSRTITHTREDTNSVHRRMTVHVIEGAKTSLANAIPSGNRLMDNSNGTSVSLAATPAGAGSMFIGQVADWDAGDSITAAANNTKTNHLHVGGSYTTAAIEPTINPLISGSSFTWGATAPSAGLTGVMVEIVPAGPVDDLTAAALANSAPVLGAPAISRPPLTRTNLGSFPSGSPTGSFTPPNNSLLVVVFDTVGYGSEAPNIVPSGGSLTFTKQIDIFNFMSGGPPNYWMQTRVFTAPVATGASMTLTVSSDSTLVHVFAYTNYDTSDPTGAFVERQNPADTGALSLTLSGAPATTSEVLAGRSRVDYGGYNTTATPGSGWNELYDAQAGGGYQDLQTQYRGDSTSTTVAWSDVDDTPGSNSFAFHSFGLEIKAAGGADTVDDLTASNLANIAPTLGAPALGQTHALTAANLANIAPVLGAPALSVAGDDTLYLFDYQMDYGLNAFTLADKIVVCSQRPTTYTEANATYKIGEKNFGVGNVVASGPVAASPNGRKITTAAVSGGTVTSNGTPTHWGIIDTANSRLLAAGDMTGSEAVTTADGFSLEAMTINIPAGAA